MSGNGEDKQASTNVTLEHVRQRLESLENVIEKLIKALNEQNKSMVSHESRLNSLEVGRKKQSEIVIPGRH